MNTTRPALAAPLSALAAEDEFIQRHIGVTAPQRKKILQALQCDSVHELIGQSVPANILQHDALDLPPPCPEHAALAQLQQLLAANRPAQSLIGQGYYGTHVPAVIMRNFFENPGWYTAYTPYQAEIAQGRLELLLAFQHLVCELTGLEIANASLLDEATAAAEAMAMARRISKNPSQRFFVDASAFAQTIDVVRTRAQHFGFELVLGEAAEAGVHDVFGALLQSPDTHGRLIDHSATISALHERGAIAIVACDLMALVLTRTPASMAADIAIGSSQRFGVPMGFGGPHAAFLATRQAFVRTMPGRIIGRTFDAAGAPALRMALQTREQHIRREKANSNICTAQVLLANLAALYAIWHGAQGLQTIASRIHRLTALAAQALTKAGFAPLHTLFFDTLRIATGAQTSALLQAARAAGFQLAQIDEHTLGFSLDETVTLDALARLLAVFGYNGALDGLDAPARLTGDWLRADSVPAHALFNRHHSEHQMLRYLKRLQSRDLALDHSMIALGSCTMKLTAAAQMLPLSWPTLAAAHPFAPPADNAGTLAMIESLATQIKAITGFDAVSLQPNSGASGEYAGMVAIARYHAARGDSARTVCLIPRSAHGTNPATAQMCGMQIVTVDCDANGNVDVADLKAKAAAHASKLAALMITYPSTHGVFESAIGEICATIHAHGGQVYMDGANLNAQVGLIQPAAIGADVLHMNLHKTFAIPHGGGGPGMGPIGLKAHLAPYMPDHVLYATGDDARPNKGQGAISAAPFGSASILAITWMYITMMGAEGLKQATQNAILNANYLAHALGEHYPVLYRGEQGRVAHECIIDLRPLKAATGISETDIAKRLMDYGFHAPTVSFPVAGTFMIEPTESEDLAEMDRFIAAMVAIRAEIRQIENGVWPRDDNPLKNAPHTERELTRDDWPHPYSRQIAAWPLPWLREHKFWPFVSRIDEIYGDRNLACTLPPPDQNSAQSNAS